MFACWLKLHSSKTLRCEVLFGIERLAYTGRNFVLERLFGLEDL